MMPHLEKFMVVRVQQIHAIAQVQYHPDNEGLFYSSAFLLLARELPRSVRGVFPKVNAMPKPVVIVFAGFQRHGSGDDGVAHLLVAPVKSKHNAGKF